MTDRPDEEDPVTDPAPARSEREIANQLRLRPAMPGVTRLSRKVLIGLGAVASIGIGGALVVALQGRDAEDQAAELYNTDRVAQADGLGRLPRDYTGLPRTGSDVPQLGPPLPGDMGRPMLSAQQRGEAMPLPPVAGAPVAPGAPPVDPAIQRAQQEREAARTSPLFGGGQDGGGSAPPVQLSPALPAPAGEAPAPTQPSGRGEAFLARDVDRRTVSPDRVRLPASPYILQAGAVIPAALVTGIRSDLPGQVTAQVTAAVYDGSMKKLGAFLDPR